MMKSLNRFIGREALRVDHDTRLGKTRFDAPWLVLALKMTRRMNLKTRMLPIGSELDAPNDRLPNCPTLAMVSAMT